MNNWRYERRLKMVARGTTGLTHKFNPVREVTEVFSAGKATTMLDYYQTLRIAW